MCFILLLSAIFLIFYPHSQSPFLLTKTLSLYMVTSFTLLGSLFAARRGKDFPLPPFSILVPFAAFLLYAVIRLPWSAPLYPSLNAPFIWDGLFFAFLLTTAYASQPDAGVWPGFVLTGVGAIASFYGLLQHFGIDLPVYSRSDVLLQKSFATGTGAPPFSTFGNPSFFAEYLAGLLPLTLVMVLEARDRRFVFFLSVSSALMFVALLLAEARAAWTGFLAAILFLALFGRGLLFNRRALALAFAFIGIALLVLIPSKLVPGSGRAVAKAQAALTLSEGSIGLRPFWWRVTWEVVKDHPLIGVGTGRFSEVYPRYQRVFFQRAENLRFAKFTEVDGSLESPHNQHLHILAEQGLVGLALFIWVLYASFRVGFRAMKAHRGRQGVALGAMAGVLALCVDGLFAYPFQVISSGLLFSILLGLVASEGKLARERSQSLPRMPGKQLAILLLGAMALLSFRHLTSSITVYISSLHLYRGTESFLRGYPLEAVNALERARDVNPQDPQIRLELSRAYRALGRKREAIQMAEAGKLGFSSPALYRLLGSLHYDLGEYREAEREYQEGIATFPGSARLRALYGALLARLGRYQESLSELERARSLNPRYPDTYHYLGHLYTLLDRPDEARSSLEEFLRLASPNDHRRSLDEALLKRLTPPPNTPPLKGKGPPSVGS